MASPDKLGRRIAALMAGDGAKPVRAYHGSPHNFDRFDASKIGTGEGAQAYGHGLYFAGSEDAARTYRDKLSAGSLIVEGATSPFTERSMRDKGLGFGAIHYIRRAVNEGMDPVSRLQEVQSLHRPQSRRWQEMADAIEFLQSAKGPLKPHGGHMYEVELDVPEEAFLDWDRPVMRQAGPVADYAKSLGYGGDVWRGQELYLDLGRFTPEDVRPGWTSILNTINDVTTRPQVAAARLMEAGIPGIRYLDGNSRAAGSGTHNYVMFPGTEDHIRILRKYGLLAPMALPALQEGE